MVIGLGGPVGGSNEDKITLDRALFWRRRWLREILQRRILVAPFLRVGGLFEGGIVRPNLEAVPVA
jgi:hypothetical protein